MNRSIILAGNMKNGKDTAAEFIAKTYGHVVVGFADELKRVTAWLFQLDDTAFWGSSDERNKPLADPLDVARIERVAAYVIRHGRAQSLDALFEARVTPAQIADGLLDALLPVAPITSARVLLQRMGTEWGRALWPDVWVYAVERTRRAVETGVPYFRRDGLQPRLKTRLAPAPIVVPDGRHANELRYGFETLKCPSFWIDASRRVPRDTRFDHSSEPTRASLAAYLTDDVDNNGTLDELRANVDQAIFRHHLSVY